MYFTRLNPLILMSRFFIELDFIIWKSLSAQTLQIFLHI